MAEGVWEEWGMNCCYGAMFLSGRPALIELREDRDAGEFHIDTYREDSTVTSLLSLNLK